MSEWTVDVNEENFETEVLDRSKEVPVVIDFWAPWCGPCKVLGPVLEKLAGEYGGDFVLAKVNVDENQNLAGAFGIQGIPAVKLFKDGELASEFTGALPEPAVRDFLSKFLPSAADKLAQQGAALEAEGKTAEAKAYYQSILESDPNHAGSLLGLGRLAMNESDNEAALQYLDKISIVDDERKEADRLIARLQLQSGAAENLTALRDKVNAAPNDLAACFDLAHALAGAERYAEALDEFLKIVKTDRTFQEDGARKAMIQIFEVLGSEDSLVDKYRSELAAVLFR
ncbi:MAG: thioredoxin [Candidatus Binatia bacterium]